MVHCMFWMKSWLWLDIQRDVKHVEHPRWRVISKHLFQLMTYPLIYSSYVISHGCSTFPLLFLFFLDERINEWASDGLGQVGYLFAGLCFAPAVLIFRSALQDWMWPLVVVSWKYNIHIGWVVGLLGIHLIGCVSNACGPGVFDVTRRWSFWTPLKWLNHCQAIILVKPHIFQWDWKEATEFDESEAAWRVCYSFHCFPSKWLNWVMPNPHDGSLLSRLSKIKPPLMSPNYLMYTNLFWLLWWCSKIYSNFKYLVCSELEVILQKMVMNKYPTSESFLSASVRNNLRKASA